MRQNHHWLVKPLIWYDNKGYSTNRTGDDYECDDHFAHLVITLFHDAVVIAGDFQLRQAVLVLEENEQSQYRLDEALPPEEGAERSDPYVPQRIVNADRVVVSRCLFVRITLIVLNHVFHHEERSWLEDKVDHCQQVGLETEFADVLSAIQVLAVGCESLQEPTDGETQDKADTILSYQICLNFSWLEKLCRVVIH